MPTSRPRYQVTDTGPVRAMLDDAAQRWPDVRDRKALLLRLMEAGAAQFDAERAAVDAEAKRVAAAELRARQIEAHERSRKLIDVELLLSDAAWK